MNVVCDLCGSSSHTHKRCKVDDRVFCPESEYGPLGVCSKKCYASQFVPGKVPVDTGLRYNKDKERIDLIPAEVILALGEHYRVGAAKYFDNNWRKGFPYSETYSCAQRHLLKWQAGERDDPENGAHHLIAAIWNLMTLFYFELFPERYGKFDDRWKQGPFGDVIEPDPNEWKNNYTSEKIPTDLTGGKLNDPDKN